MELVIFYTHDQVREEDLIRCNDCKSQIAFVEDHLEIVQNGRTGIFNSVFNVELVDSENYLRQVNGNTVADVYCTRCGVLLGLKLIAVPRPSQEISAGRFLMKLSELVYWDDCPMLFIESDDEQDADVDIDQILNELDGGANVEQVADEQGEGANVEKVANGQGEGANVEQVANEQGEGANVELVATEQGGGADVEEVDNEQDGGAYEQVPDDQDGGADEEDANHDVDELADKIGNMDLNF
ncbi:unnamed protein product [Withania somnifera]